MKVRDDATWLGPVALVGYQSGIEEQTLDEAATRDLQAKQ